MYLFKFFLVLLFTRSSFGGYGIGQPSYYGGSGDDTQADVSAPRYTPSYLRYASHPSYGQYPPNLYASRTAGIKTAGVKTAGVKTAGRGAYNSQYSVKSAECGGLPFQYINNGKVMCAYTIGKCRIQCADGYQLPNGKTTRSIVCQNGNWMFEDPTLPNDQACEPICLPTCQNNGICIAPDECNCPENFNGPQCQYENKPCVDFPPLPMNAHRSCSADSCTIKCMPQHTLPDGTTLTNMYCREGQWVPSRSDWVTVPDCKPTCDPPCQNQGVCLSFNMCQCPLDFRGPQCQYSSDACSVTKLAYNGGYSCSGDADSFSCELRCPSPGIFSSPPAERYTCLYSTGRFEPQPVPMCNYGSNVAVHGGSSKTIWHPSHPTNEGDGSEVVYVSPVYGASTHRPHSHTVMNDSRVSTIESGSIGTEEVDKIRFIKPRPGVCFTWGGSHYKTFDGQVYSFQSPCRHILVRDSVDHLFTVIVKHGACMGHGSCSSQIYVYLQDKEYIISKNEDGDIKFSTTKRLIPIPARLPGISVSLLAHTVVIELESVGATVKWDTHQLVQVFGSESLWNRTEGLCGVLDGRKDTDMLTKDRQWPKTIATLADAWQARTIGDICETSPSTEDACSKKSEIIADQAERFCKKLLNIKKFQKCATVLNISLLMDACQWDFCNCATEDDPEECACGSIAVYAKQCVLSGVTELQSWRDTDTCPMKCTDGKIYNSCGAESQPSCSQPSTFVAPTSVDTCTEGCFCPEGLFLDEGKCIPKQECPCRLRNKNFNSGAVIPKGCNTCKCEAGEWKCTQVNCGARCGAIGDPHYTTFDGRHYDFMGKCSYHLLAGNNYTIDVENVACPGAISDAMNLARTYSSGGSPSCTKAVTITYGGAVIKLNQRGIVMVNGGEIKMLPALIDDIAIRAVSSLFLVVELPNGIDVFWDTVTRVFVDVPSTFREKTKGLCGTFNDNQKDDFLTPEGDVEQSVSAFVNKWKTREICDDVAFADVPDTCAINVQNKELAEKYCNKLKSDLFRDCHWHVDVEPFFQDCMYDLCACEGDIGSCLCPIMGAYATECATQGVMVDWRLLVNECEIKCSGGQSYQVCADSCTRTCSDVSHNMLSGKGGRAPCKPKCVEGCACPAGHALHVNGECIPVGMCPCHHDGLEFRPGYKEVRDGKTEKVFCTCQVGKWKCRPATPEEILTYPRASDIKDKCNADNNLEFTTCESAEPHTCKNMHLPQATTTAECRPGCQCKKGYVLESVSKKCILPVDCPCHHGGQSYPDGHKRPEECNTCECKKGTWACTERQCNGVCNAWGDSHFTTFDGKEFDFQGVCTYLMTQGVEGENIFTVEIQNEPCGTTGATCAKSIILKVGSGPKEETVALTKHNPIPETSELERIKSYEVGSFVFLDVASMGVILQWDKATRVYIKVDPKWKNRVKGLCGNYNNDIRDDFQTPSGGGISEASPLLFADSWRLTPNCPPASALQNHCEERPFRKDWATTTCGALNRPPFTKCHSEVPPEAYIQRCERDACACDSGGDCECVCIALATYSQLCAARGVIFKWRSKELCPCQCDEETSAYDPCISACPEETCENTLYFDGVKKICKEDTCVEGCRLKKKCPQGSVFANNSLSDCVPRAACKPTCMTLADGRVVLEGETIEQDDCHTCHCSRKQKVCTGQPCSTIAVRTTPKTYPSSTPLTTLRPNNTTQSIHTWEPFENEDCATGWSGWINNNIGRSTFVNGQEITTEHEDLPIIEHMLNTEGLGACEPDKMTDIQCRTVEGHKNSKELPFATACSLDRGFTCRSVGPNKCPDFEFRVFCQCSGVAALLPPEKKFPQCLDAIRPNHEHPTDCHKFYQCVPGSGPPEHPHLVEKTCGSDMWYNPDTMTCDWQSNVQPLRPFCAEVKEEGREEIDLAAPRRPQAKPKHRTSTTTKTPETTTVQQCANGEVWSDCAIECDILCHGYAQQLKKNGICISGMACEGGCVPADEATRECEHGLLRRDKEVCVPSRDCTCASKNGTIVKPGAVRHEGACLDCQCINNDYSCHEVACIKTAVNTTDSKATGRSMLNHIPISTTTTAKPYLVISTTMTPPPVCSEDRYKNLLWDESVPGYKQPVLTASSSASDAYSPQNAVLNGNKGAGSWTPEVSDLQQYIQVELPRREPVYGVVMQGSPLFSESVTNYEIMYGDDGNAFSYVNSDEGIPKVFQGSTDNRKAVKQMFDHPIEAKYLRVKPLSWNDRISVRFEVIGCRELQTTPGSTVTTPKPYEYTNSTEPAKTPTTIELPQCMELMGFSKGLPLRNVEVSSEKQNAHNLDVNQEIAWRPTFSTPGEWIYFDFTGSRNITGILTKGGKTGFVKSYKVLYAPETNESMKSWSFITNDDGSDKVFTANYDGKSPVKNMFTRPVHLRYMKILPLEWEKNIELRVEPIGCYQPYPVDEQTAPVHTMPTSPSPTDCRLCPGVLSGPLDKCNCTIPKDYFDGERCTTLQLCPCFVGLMQYAVGATFQNSNCEQCTCKMGGVPDCVPAKCPKCAPGLVPKKSMFCECLCEPCAPGERICPTSEVCVSEDKWCNGITDCPDDEIDCATTPPPTFAASTTAVPPSTTPKTKEEKCAEPSCPAGYKASLVTKRPTYERLQEEDSPMAQDSLLSLPPPRPRKTYNRYFKGIKGGGTKGLYTGTKTKFPSTKQQSTAFTLSKPSARIVQADVGSECPKFKCVSNRTLPPYPVGKPKPTPPPCPVTSCPKGYKLSKDRTEKIGYGQCPKYTCMPPPKKDGVCQVTGRTFNTFDGTEYKYDICDHLLARDAHGDKWSVIIQKNCSLISACARELLVVQDGDHVRMVPSLQVEYNGFPYTVDQTKKIGMDKEQFILSSNGDVLFYVSKKYPFWVTYTTQGDVKIGVQASLSGAVDGLCGYYDGKPDNDRRLPAGNQVMSTEIFGDAWSRPDLPPNACEARVCPLDLQAKAWDMCNVISENTLSVCKKVMNLVKWREQCLESVCECAQAGNVSLGKDSHECLCEALQSFVVECQAADRSIDLQGWRTEVKCPAECPAPLVHHDCYRRRCEPSCSTLVDGAEQCAPAPAACFPGCFCPEGKLRKGDECVMPEDCRDCVCDGKGTPAKYTTFERADLPFSGNCTYIAVRDKNNKAEYKFQVFVTNGACEGDSKSVCAEAVHIIHGQHVLHVQKNNKAKKLEVTVDGSPVYKSLKNDWLMLTILPGKDVSILIPEVQLEVNSLFKNMDFNVRVPSYMYANKTEGLCGNCQGVEEELVTQNGTLTTDVKEYGISWLANKPALKALDIKVEQSCVEKPKNECLPPPPDQDPCFKILDPQAFGMCHPVVDPIQFLTACQQDLCRTGKQLGICSSLEQYATECRRAGLCVDWRSKDLCPYPCEGDLKYSTCGLGCALTCENYKDLTNNPKQCDAPAAEGCFCPEGKVLVNNTCIEHTKCFPCDAEQQHYAGDEWEVDACTKCTCVKSERDDKARVACTKQSCSPPVCSPKEVAEKLPTKPTECCPHYICVPKATESPLCEEPQKITCGFGQDLKLERNSKGCKKYSCQCKPKSECKPIPSVNEIEPLEPGMERVIDNSGCCPREEFVCNKRSCPQSPACPQFKDLKTSNITGKCCPEYECVFPEDKCIVKLEWENKPEGGDKQREQPQMVLKALDEVWPDGVCHTCRCVRLPGGPAAQCSHTECPEVVSTDSLLVEPLSVPYTCCPLPKYVACKHADKVFKVGENFTKPGEPCVSYECVPTNDGKLEKRTTLQKCETKCKPGWEYTPAAPGSGKCCGVCSSVSCIVDGDVHAIGEVWISSDHCTTYRCVSTDGDVQVRSESVSCAEASKQLLQQYEVKVVSVPGECCEKLLPVACKYEGRVYQEGEIWPTSQPCVNMTCSRDAQGHLAQAETVTVCSEDCPRGFQYKPALDPQVCCGQCVPIACVDGDVLREINSTWQSEDNCTTSSCSVLDGQPVLSSHSETCPDISKCKPEDLEMKGCCKICKPQALSQTACDVEEISPSETVGLVKKNQPGGGSCENLEPIAGLKQCRGGCPSVTGYNNKSKKFDLSNCTCCRPAAYTNVIVKLTCRATQRTAVQKVSVPTSCACTPCADTGSGGGGGWGHTGRPVVDYTVV